MGLSRRFLNLIVNDSVIGVRSLRCIDLTRKEFFFPTTTEQIQLPSPTISFKARGVSCLPLADRKVLCTDRRGHAFLFDADTHSVVTMPTLHRCRWNPVSLFVPNAGGRDDADPDPDVSLFVMERKPKQEARSDGPQSDQFEALVYRMSSTTSPSKSWHHQLLPSPPYLRDRKYRCTYTEIGSYAVVGNGSHVWISVHGVGTYCLDTVKHTWSKASEGTLPCPSLGKLEYVPDLKLWFGLADNGKAQILVAADLSMDSPPVLVGAWNLELDHAPGYRPHVALPWCPGEMALYDFSVLSSHSEWCERQQDSRLVHLGSGRFCIARSFSITGTTRTCFGNELTFERFAEFTGVEVSHASCSSDDIGIGDGKVKLVALTNKPKRTPSDGTLIDAVF